MRPSAEFYSMLPIYQIVSFGLFNMVIIIIMKINKWRNNNGRKNISEKKPR